MRPRRHVARAGSISATEVLVQRILDAGEGRVELGAQALHETEMPAAMRPYSMAVAPDSSFTKRLMMFDMMLSLFWRLPLPVAQARDKLLNSS